MQSHTSYEASTLPPSHHNLNVFKTGLETRYEKQVKWNVTPLLGHFGGRVKIYRFLQSPPIPPLSFVVGSYTLFSVFMRVNACLQARGLALGTAIRVFTQLKTEKRVFIFLKQAGHFGGFS